MARAAPPAMTPVPGRGLEHDPARAALADDGGGDVVAGEATSKTFCEPPRCPFARRAGFLAFRSRGRPCPLPSPTTMRAAKENPGPLTTLDTRFHPDGAPLRIVLRPWPRTPVLLCGRRRPGRRRGRVDEATAVEHDGGDAASLARWRAGCPPARRRPRWPTAAELGAPAQAR